MAIQLSIIGSGNMAFQLGKAFFESGQPISEVYSRNTIEGKKLAELVHAKFEPEIEKLSNSGIFILAVKDDAVSEISERILGEGNLLIHTAGSIGINSIHSPKNRRGVLYPVQTLSKNKKVDFGNIPFCIEAENETDLDLIKKLVQKLSSNIYELNSEQRKVIHVAAVFACNFPNYLYSAAHQILEKEGITFDIIRPLIIETAEKVQTIFPENAQTGPALRNDLTVLNNHKAYLQNNPELLEVYTLLSKLISNR